MVKPSDISIIIPALNCRALIEQLLPSALSLSNDVIVVDGRSTDGTKNAATDLGATVIQAARGRGQQLASGADMASNDWLLFLHSDTQLPASAGDVMRRFIEASENLQKAGYFELRFDDQSRRARFIAGMANWRSRTLGLPYGDQALLISRAFYEEIGGYQTIPLMEDVDLVRCIGRRNLCQLDGAVITSAAKYRRDGWMLRPVRNLFCLSLYFLGIAPEKIARIYG
ncbi:MAG: glycosyltransferase family 2 protein [Alphaproteobacteria bacterium]|nr:glycosyltransferase family 2 protein [Alphaproteobacteria bacterium]